MRAADRLRWRSLGSSAALWVGWVAAARAAATATADFPVTVTLLPPPGCVFTASSSSSTGAPQVTLTCGSNLFVNVQPTILSSPTSSTGTSTLPAASFTATGSSPPPPAELTQSIASLMNLSDTSTSVGGAMFVQRSATAATSSALTPGRTTAQALQSGPGGSPNAPQDNASDLSGQAVEVWLIF
jgi:hypothetical protein